MKKQLKWYSFRWRILLILIIIIMTVFGYISCRLHYALRTYPMGTGPAGPEISSQPFEKPWSDKKFVFLGIGDSITRGFGVENKYSYFSLLLNNDDSMYPDMAGCDLTTVLSNIEIHNYAKDYTVTQQHLDQQLVLIPKYPTDVMGIVVITSGGNDLIHDYGRSKPVDGALYGCTYKQGFVWTENIKQRIKMLLEGIIEKFPGGCEIFLANIYDPTDGVSDPQIRGLPRWPDAVKVLGMTNAKIAELCQMYENVHLVNIHAEFLGHGFHCTEPWNKYYRKNDPTHWYHQNIEDPNRRGYDAIRRLYLQKIIEVLPEKIKRNS